MGMDGYTKDYLQMEAIMEDTKTKNRKYKIF